MGIPLAIGLVGVALGTTAGIIGSVVEHDNAKAQAEAAEQQAKLQQQQMEYNQRMQEREAAALEAESLENAKRMRQAAEDARSQRLALLGKSGAAMTSGSPLAILGAAAADEEQGIQDAHYAATRQIAAARTKAADYGYGAAIAKHNVAAAKASRPTALSLGAKIIGNVGDGLTQLGSIAQAEQRANGTVFGFGGR